ncbi:MAG: RNA 2',3'-cyclic phosphodiesterase [Rhizobiaceae bacterium]|nr:RNA 2',3'-cyclic phosphodiesterase [Rhizobiaceae bacterium]
MPRLFTGLEVPSSVRLMLSLKQSGLADVRWIDPSDFHITLRFIGDVDHQQANDIFDALSQRDWAQPHINVGETKCFGGTRPTALYAQIQPDHTLLNLSATQEQLMQRLGLAPDSRRFTPHITIGRCKNASADSIARYLSQNGAALPDQHYRPARFALYSARKSRGGGPYKIEQTWPLISQ